jgi:hypothetical protein
VCAEASTIFRAVAVDFFFNCWCLEIPLDNHAWHVPRCIHYNALSSRLEEQFILSHQSQFVVGHEHRHRKISIVMSRHQAMTSEDRTN